MDGGPPGFPRDFTCPAVLGIPSGHFALSPTGVLPAVPGLSRPLRLEQFNVLKVPQPQSPKGLVWALPVSLAATQGIDYSFSSSGYLDVSVPRVVFLNLCIQLKISRYDSGWVAPFGYPRIKACLLLPVAFRRSPRPSSTLSA